MLDATCRLRRVEVNAAALDALDPAPPAPRLLRAEGSARALDADDPAPAAAPAGGRRLDDLHAQQLAAVYAAAVYAAAGRQQFAAGGAPPRTTSWPLARTPSCWWKFGCPLKRSTMRGHRCDDDGGWSGA